MVVEATHPVVPAIRREVGRVRLPLPVVASANRQKVVAARLVAVRVDQVVRVPLLGVGPVNLLVLLGEQRPGPGQGSRRVPAVAQHPARAAAQGAPRVPVAAADPEVVLVAAADLEAVLGAARIQRRRLSASESTTSVVSTYSLAASSTIPIQRAVRLRLADSSAVRHVQWKLTAHFQSHLV